MRVLLGGGKAAAQQNFTFFFWGEAPLCSLVTVTCRATIPGRWREKRAGYGCTFLP